MIQKMSQTNAEEIAKWHYEAPYDFYDMINDEEDLHELLYERGDHYFEVLENHETEGIGAVAIQKLPDEIVKANSTEIDAVSGASTTTRAVEEAVNKAIKKAK